MRGERGATGVVGGDAAPRVWRAGNDRHRPQCSGRGQLPRVGAPGHRAQTCVLGELGSGSAFLVTSLYPV